MRLVKFVTIVLQDIVRNSKTGDLEYWWSLFRFVLKMCAVSDHLTFLSDLVLVVFVRLAFDRIDRIYYIGRLRNWSSLRLLVQWLYVAGLLFVGLGDFRTYVICDIRRICDTRRL